MAQVEPRRPAALLLALALTCAALGSGCTLAPRIEAVSSSGGGEQGPEFDAFDWPRPVRVGVTRELGRYGNLHHRIVSALEDGVDRVIVDYRPSRESERVDYVIDIGVDIDGKGRLSNFLAVFPGFVIFAPSWYQLRWDYEVTTRVRLRRGGAHEGQGGDREATLHDAFVVRHTPAGIAVGAYIGWGGLIFPPLVLSPFVTGLVAALDDWEPRHFATTLAGDPEVGWRWARGVAATVRRMIDEDLRYE